MFYNFVSIIFSYHFPNNAMFSILFFCIVYFVLSFFPSNFYTLFQQFYPFLLRFIFHSFSQQFYPFLQYSIILYSYMFFLKIIVYLFLPLSILFYPFSIILYPFLSFSEPFYLFSYAYIWSFCQKIYLFYPFLNSSTILYSILSFILNLFPVSLHITIVFNHFLFR